MGFQEKGDKLEFFVRDTGIGISPEAKENIFKRFTQAEISTEKIYGGTGLGPSIAKACAELLKGEIWVESELGKGTTFYFTIDYIKSDKKLDSTKNDELADVSFSGETILITEDNNINYAVLSEILREHNLNLLRATNGKEAINMVLGNKEISLVLMDIQMPALDGWEATKILRQKGVEIPIIAQTAYSFTSDKNKSLEAGCSGFISKPIDPNKLTQLLYKHLYSKN